MDGDAIDTELAAQISTASMNRQPGRDPWQLRVRSYLDAELA